MSGREDTETRLSQTGFGRDAAGRARRYDGLALADYQKRELRLAFAERWPHDTARSASRALGEPHQTVRNWLEGLTFPNGFKLLKLKRHLGLAFLARLDPEPDAEMAIALDVIRRRALEDQLARVTELLAAPLSPRS